MLSRFLVADAEALYEQYHRIVYAFLFRLSGSPEVAEDLLQETFYRAIRGAAGYRGESPPAGWLCAIARRLYADQVKRWSKERSRRGEVSWDLIPDGREGPEAEALREERWTQIQAVLAQLPEPQRLALMLRDWDGLPYETIADMLDLSLSNTKVTIHRARVRFRSIYEAQKE